MFRNQYDTDITTWSPGGKLFQIDYAIEAVKQGSCTLGAKSKDSVVVVALKRAPDKEVAAHISKMFSIDRHVGISIAGLVPDARSIARMMRQDCVHYRFIFGSTMPVPRVVYNVASKSQEHTQRGDLRPHGVGLLVAGMDSNGPHLFQTCPSGNYYDCHATAIGARSQSARSYLERHYDNLADMSLEELRKHCLRALASTLGERAKLTAEAVSILQIGPSTGGLVQIMDDDESVAPHIDELLAALEVEAQAAEAAASAADDTGMLIDA